MEGCSTIAPSRRSPSTASRHSTSSSLGGACGSGVGVAVEVDGAAADRCGAAAARRARARGDRRWRRGACAGPRSRSRGRLRFSKHARKTSMCGCTGSSIGRRAESSYAARGRLRGRDDCKAPSATRAAAAHRRARALGRAAIRRGLAPPRRLRRARVGAHGQRTRRR